MAAVGLRLSFDASPVYDALVELCGAHERLARRHGARFRDLEREIEAIMEGVRASSAMSILGMGRSSSRRRRDGPHC